MQEQLIIKKIAVLGAGVMGAQIAAHCVNAGFNTLLFDLTAAGDNHNAIADKAINNLAKLNPTPLATKETLSLLKAKNYDDNLSELTDCSLIIEAIGERLDWKTSLYQRITPYLTDASILVTNTSGLSINTLANTLPDKLRANFCGVHFFNPPRYMHLAELIPSKSTSQKLLDQLESWLTSYLGKGVVRAHDTPNFIANRVGVFSLLATLHHAEKYNLGLDLVDALTGSLLGRPKSATFRTMDVVGLDTMKHVVDTMLNQLDHDPWNAVFKLPGWLDSLIKEGHLGQKTGQGIYRKNGKMIEVYDIKTGQYRESKAQISDEVKAILQMPDKQQSMQQLLASQHPEAQFLSACFLDLFQYVAFHLQEIASTVRDVDLAMRWGFGWSRGPFETWQASGVLEVKAAIEHAIKTGAALATVELPAWCEAIDSFYSKEGAFSPTQKSYLGRSNLPVYKRQFFPESVLNEQSIKGETLFENDGVHLWRFKDDIAVVNFKSKANTVGQAVLDGLGEAIHIAEQGCRGLIIHQKDGANFSSGADLRAVSALIQANKFQMLEAMIEQFQQVAMHLKYSSIPTVAAVRGRALGGGCEFMLHTDAVVAAFESYPGLVEIGVGLIPAGGGCKEMAMRAADQAKDADLMVFIKPYFEQIAMGVVASSAVDAKVRGYLRPTDPCIMNTHEVLYAALAKINAMQAANYLPPLQRKFKIAGREGHARLQAGLVNWLEGGFISQHDYLITNHLAAVICGGDLYEGELVDEAWMLKLEKEAFMALAETPLTQARISYLLETGKPLRN